MRRKKIGNVSVRNGVLSTCGTKENRLANEKWARIIMVINSDGNRRHKCGQQDSNK